jgi:hypothetical protein
VVFPDGGVYGYQHSKCWDSGAVLLAVGWLLPAKLALKAWLPQRYHHKDTTTLKFASAAAAALLLLCTCVCGRFVRRRYDPLSGVVSVAGVEEQHGIQAAAGDLLYLKGNAFPGLLGEGDVESKK